MKLPEWVIGGLFKRYSYLDVKYSQETGTDDEDLEKSAPKNFQSPKR